jgi:hypothetical protein
MAKTLSQRAKELKEETPESLKNSYPLYPVVRREVIGNSVEFSTLVRKRYDGKYYLIPMKYSDPAEAKAIHGIHSHVHRYLMLGVLNRQDIIDNDQINEVERLTNVK